MRRSLSVLESPGLAGRLVPVIVWALAAGLGALCGCAKLPAPPPQTEAKALPAEAFAPRAAGYPTLNDDPRRAGILNAYLEAWKVREQSPDRLKQALAPLLTVYRNAYSALGKPGDPQTYDKRLRLLWDLCGVAHTTTIPVGDIKQAIGWKEPKTPAGLAEREVALADARDKPVRARLESLPAMCRRLLRAVPVGRDGSQTYADYVNKQVRQVYLTPQLAEWSPASPLDVCGSAEPLSRTLILVSASYIDLAPKPEWSLAAVAVHESAHIDWFHSPEAAKDPRLLLVVPNERNAFAQMASFLRGVLSIRDPELKSYVDRHRAEIQQKLMDAKGRVTSANVLMGLPENDEAEHRQLPADITEARLRGDASAAVEAACPATGPCPSPEGTSPSPGE